MGASCAARIGVALASASLKPQWGVRVGCGPTDTMMLLNREYPGLPPLSGFVIKACFESMLDDEDERIRLKS